MDAETAAKCLTESNTEKKVIGLFYCNMNCKMGNVQINIISQDLTLYSEFQEFLNVYVNVS